MAAATTILRRETSTCPATVRGSRATTARSDPGAAGVQFSAADAPARPPRPRAPVSAGWSWWSPRWAPPSGGAGGTRRRETPNYGMVSPVGSGSSGSGSSGGGLGGTLDRTLGCVSSGGAANGRGAAALAVAFEAALAARLGAALAAFLATLLAAAFFAFFAGRLAFAFLDAFLAALFGAFLRAFFDAMARSPWLRLYRRWRPKRSRTCV